HALERRVVVRGREEPRLEHARGRRDARLEQRVEEGRIPPRLLRLRVGIVAHRPLSEGDREQAAGARDHVGDPLGSERLGDPAGPSRKAAGDRPPARGVPGASPPATGAPGAPPATGTGGRATGATAGGTGGRRLGGAGATAGGFPRGGAGLVPRAGGAS